MTRREGAGWNLTCRPNIARAPRRQEQERRCREKRQDAVMVAVGRAGQERKQGIVGEQQDNRAEHGHDVLAATAADLVSATPGRRLVQVDAGHDRAELDDRRTTGRIGGLRRRRGRTCRRHAVSKT